jgi:hypothetical protein
MTIEELSEKRRKHLQSKRENNDFSDETITNLYSKRSHFIYELIQNAEDEKATSVTFYLFKEKLIFEHNSKNTFTIEDIDSITTFGYSTKKGAENTIGKFGIGFKSVFAITERPEIHSGKFHFFIDQYIIPTPFNDKELNNETKIILPFKEAERETIYNQIKSELEKINVTTILFLKNIKEIGHQIDDKLNIYNKKETKKGTGQIVSFDTTSDNESFLKFDKTIEIANRETNISVAFKYKNEKIEAVDKSNLFVYFETEKNTELKFLIHAPFITTPARDNIKDDEINKSLQNELVNFIIELIDELIELKLWNVITIDTYPLKYKYNLNDFYLPFYQKMAAVFQNKQVIPSSKGKFIFAKDSIIGNKDLINLLDSNQLNILFQKRNLVSDKITADTKSILKSISVKEVSPTDFANQISTLFLKEQTDDWIIAFYGYLLKNTSLYKKAHRDLYNNYIPDGILRNKYIIRTNEDDHIQPFKNNIPNVWLSSSELEKKQVKFSICSNDNARSFLLSLGLNYPDDYAKIINEVLPKYEKLNDFVLADYWIDFNYINDTINKLDTYKSNDIVERLKKLYFILNENNKLNKPGDLYFRTINLDVLLNSDSSKFISLEYSNYTNSESLLTNIGVNKGIKIKIINRDSEYLKKTYNYFYEDDLFKKYYNRIIDIKDYDFKDIEICNLNTSQIMSIWFELCKLFNEIRWYQNIQYSLSPNPRGYNKVTFSSALKMGLNTLKLKTINDDFKPIPKITYDELHNEYKNTNSLELMRLLGCKEESIETKYKNIKKENEEVKKKNKELQKEIESLKSQVEKNNTVNIPPEESNKWNPPSYNAEKISPVEYEKPSITEKNKKEYSKNDDSKISNNAKHRKKEDVARQDKAAENFIIEILKKESDGQSIEINSMNENNNQVGYDIEVRNGNEVVKYIEVKSSTEDNYIFTLSGAQLSKSKVEGDKYYLYCILNFIEGKTPEVVVIHNPYKKMKEDELIIKKLEYFIK